MELAAAAGDLLEQILDSSYPLWGEGLTRRAYERYNTAQFGTRWGRRHLDRVALVDHGVVLSSAKRYALEMFLEGRRCRTLGIGAVFTAPELRGRGHARLLLEKILAAAASDGYEAALLFSEIGADFYAREGFTVIPHETFCVDVARRPGAPGVVVRTGDARDIPVIADMHAEMAVRYRLAMVRPPDWIEYAISKKRLLAGLAPEGLTGVLFYVVEEGGRAVAYIVMTTGRRGWTIEECGDRDPLGARVGALLQVLLAREPVSGIPPIYGWFPGDWLPPQLSIASRAAADQIMMMRPLGAAGPFTRPLSYADVLFWHADAF